MRTTSSFEIFPNEPSERDLARARWLRSEGKLDEAEDAYRMVMERQVTLRSGWTECFELLRSQDKLHEAMALATQAETIFKGEAFPLALKGAALIEQQQFKEALKVLEMAVDRDPDLALTWHELGYAAFRLGDGNRALLALDRAFALEPHTETLVLRGKILRDAGESYAAEVAFEAAQHSAEHDDQRRAIRQEIKITRRQGAFEPQWIRSLTIEESWFVQHGVTLLTGNDEGPAATDEDLIDALAGLVRDNGWIFTDLIVNDPAMSWSRLEQEVGFAARTLDDGPLEGIPLLVGVAYDPSNETWCSACSETRRMGCGLTVALSHEIGLTPIVDIVGILTADGQRRPVGRDDSTAILMAQHPAGLLVKRRLHTPEPTSQRA